MTPGLWPIAAHAEIVPPHIVSMTKELLLATRDDFKAAAGKDEQAQRVQRIYRILRREGLYNWRLKPVTRDGFVPKMAAVFGLSQIGPAETEKFIKFLEAQTGGRSDAAVDELYTALGRARATGAERKRVVDGWNALWAETWAGVALTYEMEASRGPQTISLAWDMERARFTIRVVEEGDAATRKMQTTITRLVGFAFDQKARDLIVSVRPAQMPITSGDPDIQSATAQPVQPRLGPPVRKKDEASDEKEAKTDKNEKGKGKTSADERPDKQEQIDAKRKRIEEIKSDKAHVWENKETKEKIRQKRFRKLKEPFEYRGEGYADPDADDKIKRLEREIAELEGRAPPADAEPTPARSAEETPSQPESAPKEGGPRGPFFAFSKEVYFHDEPVVVTLFNDYGGYNLFLHSDTNSYHLPSAEGYVQPRFDDHNPGSTVVKFRGLSLGGYPSNKPGRLFEDYEISYEYRRRQAQWRKAGFIRIVRRDGLLPGAVKIVGGERQPLGKELIVEVDVPDQLIAGRGEANRYDKRAFFLDVVAAGRPVRGGAVEPEHFIKSFPVKASHSRFDISDTVYEYTKGDASEPGLYLIKLRAGGFLGGGGVGLIGPVCSSPWTPCREA